jgi:hypothetical protein
MSARLLNIGIRKAAERSEALRKAMRRVGGGDCTQQKAGALFREH